MSSVKHLNEILKTRGPEAALKYAEAAKMLWVVKLIKESKWDPEHHKKVKVNQKKKIKNRMPDDEWKAMMLARKEKNNLAASKAQKAKKRLESQEIRNKAKGACSKKEA